MHQSFRLPPGLLYRLSIVSVASADLSSVCRDAQLAIMMSGAGAREVDVKLELGGQPFDPAAFLRDLVVARL